MDKDQTTQQILNQAQAALKRADDTISATQTNLDKLEEDLEAINKKNNKTQAAIDQEIVEIVQDMDEATIQFVKDTE